MQSQVDSADTNNLTSDSSRDSHALAAVRASAAPFIWIGGETPLRYPRVGQIARQIISSGKIFFVEMDGTLLRRRIHEFRPGVAPLSGFAFAMVWKPPTIYAPAAGNYRPIIGERPRRQAFRVSHLRETILLNRT